MAGLLDPWNDAAEIATRLAAQNSWLVVVLGAQAWCQQCRDAYPQFEALARQHASPRSTWLWLDLEDHVEFIGDFIPDDLPLLLVYQGDVLRMMQCVSARTAMETMIADIQGTDPIPVSSASDPGIRQRLLQPDWAVD